MLTIGVDIGGTNIRASVVADSGMIRHTVQTPTPSTTPALNQALDQVVRELSEQYPVGAVGLAVAGFVDTDRCTVRFAPHLPWREAPVTEWLQERVGVPVVLEHDANAALWAEYRFGAAGGAQNVVLVAIGTGIGAALLIGDRLFRGSCGIAPELGHVQVIPQGRVCGCGKRGCWERYCSGTALADTARDMLTRTETSALAAEIRSNPDALTGRRVADAARAGDVLGRQVMADFAHWLALGLALVGDVFDPDLIVVAGGVSGSAGLFLEATRQHYRELVTGGAHRSLATIRVARLGAAAGMIGAAELARTTVLEPSTRSSRLRRR